MKIVITIEFSRARDIAAAMTEAFEHMQPRKAKVETTAAAKTDAK